MNHTASAQRAFTTWYNNLTKHNPNQRFGVFRRTLNHTASAQRAFTTWYNNLTKHNPNQRFGE
ncbi:MAG: hypothetical protein SOZ38_02120, partial [Oscillospiraceae bacterium]|nr:hypothetical protein [Oscillospiraceae bacterium]